MLSSSSSTPTTSAPKKKHPLLSGIAGGAAGICEITVTMPLDTLKTRMQLGSSSSSSAAPERPSMLRTFNQIRQTTGIRGLYAGYSAMFTQVSLKAGIRFSSYQQVKTILEQQKAISLNTVQVNALSGVLAGVVEAGVWVTPTERLKVLRQSSSGTDMAKQYDGFFRSMRTVVQTHGVGGLFVGFVPTAARQGMAMGVRFALFDEMKGVIGGVCGDSVPKPLQSLAAEKSHPMNPSSLSLPPHHQGMATGVISSLLNQPIDTAKTRIQAREIYSKEAYTGTVDCLRKMFAREGFLSWYAGAAPRVLRLTIGQGIIFSCQEQISNALHANIAL